MKTQLKLYAINVHVVYSCPNGPWTESNSYKVYAVGINEKEARGKVKLRQEYATTRRITSMREVRIPGYKITLERLVDS